MSDSPTGPVNVSPELPKVWSRSGPRRGWITAYEDRIAAGLETCRACGSAEDLTVCRIRYDRDWWLGNLTILCADDSAEYYDDFQPHRRRRQVARWRLEIPPLYIEERSAPRGERWGLNAQRTKSYRGLRAQLEARPDHAEKAAAARAQLEAEDRS